MVLEAYLRVFFFRVALCLNGIFPCGFSPGGFCRMAYFLDAPILYVSGVHFSWNLKVFTKSFKISENHDIEHYFNLSYGEFEIINIRLRCSLGQTNPLYAKMDFSYLIL